MASQRAPGSQPPPPPPEWQVREEVVFGSPRINLMEEIRSGSRDASPELNAQGSAPAAAGDGSPPLIASITCSPRRLAVDHPPRFRCANKIRLYDECQRRVSPSKDEQPLSYRRFGPARLPRSGKLQGAAPAVLAGVYDYAQSTASTTEWYVNFADRKLFGFFEGNLFAQDEMQVQEHPSLGSLRLYLEREAQQNPGLVPLTVGDQGPTPCLIERVPQACAVDTRCSEEAPRGLYGNAFARAQPDVVVRATTFHAEPRTTNVLAIEAPKPCRGEYTHGQLVRILETAYTGFAAVAAVSNGDAAKDGAAVRVHTGHWGCGAYGGSKPLMALLQTCAARLAGVSLVYHAFDEEGVAAAEAGLQKLDELLDRIEVGPEGTAILDKMLAELVKMGFKWGQSDGN